MEFCSLHSLLSDPTCCHLLQGVLIPIFSRTKWAIFQPGHLLMSMMNCFAGGVFLTFGFMHFLGDAAAANTAVLGNKYNLVSWATIGCAGLPPCSRPTAWHGCRGSYCCMDAAEGRAQVWATDGQHWVGTASALALTCCSRPCQVSSVLKLALLLCGALRSLTLRPLWLAVKAGQPPQPPGAVLCAVPVQTCIVWHPFLVYSC